MHQNFAKVQSEVFANWPDGGPTERISIMVQRLSNLYVERRTDLSQIWSDPALANAYIQYFLPLNYLRLKAVLIEAQALGFFAGLDTLLDFGSGPGTVDFALSEVAPALLKERHFVERAINAREWHKKLLPLLGLSQQGRTWDSECHGIKNKTTLATFSYALNEVAELPKWALEAEALLIVEPSTQEAGRQLLSLRQRLLEAGYSAWAPCTHQGRCPLLTLSPTDWCHQRIHIEVSPRFKEIEARLPMKNQTVTYSYLLMRRTPAPARTQIRVIGDTLYERGKVRQAICRGEKREFLTWLTRHGEPEPLPRGILFDLPDGSEEKGTEIRMPAPTSQA